MMSQQDHRIHLDVYSHFCKVTNYNAHVREALKDYCSKHLTEWEMKWNPYGRFMERVMKCIYVSANADRRTFRFHRNELDQILRILDGCGYGPDKILTTVHPMYEPAKVDFKLNPKDHREPREHQPVVIGYMTDPPHPDYAPSKMVELFTGGGKTMCLLRSVSAIGFRTILFLKPMYIKKWIKDVKEAYRIRNGDLLVVQGSKDLRNLIAMANNGTLVAKIIIMSIPTFRNYLSAFEAYNDEDVDEYGCHPEQFYERLGIGVKAVDEVHQEFHAVYRQDLFAHVPLTISLSATMVSDRSFMNERYVTTWPLVTRSPKIENKKYIDIINLWYDIQTTGQIRCKDFQDRYSHVMLEQWIMKKEFRLAKYADMIINIVDEAYIQIRKDGQKALIFCATREMCTYLRDQIKSAFPKLKVGRYIQGDAYKDMLKNDITVSTLKSAGTAVDVPGLKMCLCTIAVSSKQANEQAIGRLRELRDYPGENPVFYFLSCHQIDKHRQYAVEKSQKLEGKVRGYREISTSYRI